MTAVANNPAVARVIHSGFTRVNLVIFVQVGKFEVAGIEEVVVLRVSQRRLVSPGSSLGVRSKIAESFVAPDFADFLTLIIIVEVF